MGKTSLLEAIYILGRGRSFRDKQISNAVLQRGKSSFTVFGKKGSKFNKSAIGVGFVPKRDEFKYRREKNLKLSLLAKETIQSLSSPQSRKRN